VSFRYYFREFPLETIVPNVSPDLFLEFTIPNGPRVNSGDFYIGYQAHAPSQGVSLVVDSQAAGSVRINIQ
jgi:hypothetical protein